MHILPIFDKAYTKQLILLLKFTFMKHFKKRLFFILIFYILKPLRVKSFEITRMKILFTIFKITLIVINFFPVLLFGQDSKNLTWKICAEIKHPNVKAYAVFDSTEKFMGNFLIHKRIGRLDTIKLHTKYSMIPGFKNSCKLEKVQFDGKGSKEIIVTYGNSYSVKTDSFHVSIQKNWTIKQIWNIDQRKRLMIFTTDFFWLEITPLWGGDDSDPHKFKLAGYDRDSCIYQLNVSFPKKRLIKIEKIQETGNCRSDLALFTYDEGYYVFKKGKLQKRSLYEK